MRAEQAWSVSKGKAFDSMIKTTSPGQLAHSWMSGRPLSAHLSSAPSLMSTLKRNCTPKRLQSKGGCEFSEAGNPEPKGSTFFFLAGKLCPYKLPGSIWVPTFLTCKLTTFLSYPAAISRGCPQLLAHLHPSLGSGLHLLLSQFSVRCSLDYFPTVTTSWGSPSLCSLPES